MSRSRKKYAYEQESPKWYRRLQKRQRRTYERSHGVEADEKVFGRQWWQGDYNWEAMGEGERGRRK
jgi:hypothetical protein